MLKVAGLEAAFFEKEGVKYLSFEIAKLKDPDKFGRTHTCYFQTKSYTGKPKDQEPQQAKKADKKNRKNSLPKPWMTFRSNINKKSHKAFFVYVRKFPYKISNITKWLQISVLQMYFSVFTN
jgi:hypothetical protein